MRTLTAAAIVTLATLRSAPAEAYRLNVVAASELRLDPAVPAGTSALTVRVHLRDDRGAPLARRAVSLRFQPAGQGDRAEELRTDDNGDGVARLDVGRSRRVRVSGTFAGDSTAASARGEIDVDFDAPFVTADLLLPGEGVTLGEGSVEAIVTVRVGEVQTLSPARLAVELSQVLDASGRRRSLAAGATDAAGRVSLVFPVTRFGAPGAVRIVPRVDLGRGRVVEGAGRELLVRARTAISLLREDDDGDEREGARLYGAVVLAGGAPVPGAALRVTRGERTLAAARADDQGHFRVRLGPEVLSEAGVSVRALFEPPEPWFIASESPELEVTPPSPPPIHWAWGAVPLALAALAVGWISLRRKEIEPTSVPQAPPLGADQVLRVARPTAAGVTLRVVVVDRATGRPVRGARARLDDGAWAEVSEVPLPWEGAQGACQLSLQAEGFAPRSLRVPLPEPGEYRVQVAMQTWREALFARLRPWLESARRADALPTPRELTRGGAADEALRPLVGMVERGCYGPQPPGPDELRAADDIAEAARAAGASAMQERR